MIVMEGVDYTSAFISAFWLCFVGYLVCYFLMSYSLYVMAKRKGLSKLYMAFIPFVRYLIAGKLIGNVYMFGRRTDKIGLFALIVTAVYTFCTVYTTVYSYYFVVEALISKLPVVITDTNVFINGHALSSLQEAYIPMFFTILGTVLDILSSVCTLAWIYIMYTFWNGFFIKYKPGRSTMYTIVALFASFITMGSFFFPIEVGGIFLFIFRNREPVKINIVYGNPYMQNPYGNPYNQNPYNQNPYGDPYGRDDQSYKDPYGRDNQTSAPKGPKPEEPFGEFDNDKKDKTEKDDFFN